MPRRAAIPLTVLDALRVAQSDVVRRSQLAKLGIGHDKVRREILAGRWQQVHPAVVALHSGPLTVEQQHWAAVLAQPALAALAGETAAIAHGLSWSGGDDIHVVVPTGSRFPALDGVALHVSRRFSGADLHPVRTPPSVRVERALIDAATWSVRPRTACGFLAAGVQQRLTTAPRLIEELNAAGLVNHRKLLWHCLADIEGGAQSLAEIDFGKIAAAAGVPTPIRQSVRLDARGRRRFIDVDFGGFDAEVDGALHLRPLSYWEDMARQNDIVIAGGRPMLRFSSLALRIDVPTVQRQLRTAHARWGSSRDRLFA